MGSTTKNIFLKPKPELIIIKLSDENEHIISQLAKETNTTFTHTHATLSHFKKLGYVTLEKEGRVVKCKITPAGIKVADIIIDLAVLSEEPK